MATFFKKNKKKIAVLCAMILFVFASGYTSIYSLRKSVEVKLNERSSASSEAESIILTNASYNKTLKELLEENDLPTSDDYVYGTDLDKKVREVDVLTINKKIPGTVTVDGKTYDFDSGAETVGDVIKENDITLNPSDEVEPSIDTLLSKDSALIRIYRQTRKRETREETIPFEKTQTPDASIANGTVVVDIPGIDGKKRITEDVVYRDGQVVSRTVVEEETLLEPISQVERVGTGTGTPATPSTTPTPTPTVPSGTHVSYRPTNLSASDLDLICAIVHHESGGGYEGTLAVMSCVMNRVDSPNFPNDPVSVLTAPGQFASYTEGYYKAYTGGKSSAATQQAVQECLGGKRSHNYTSFRNYQTPGSHNISGNWYF